MRKHYRNGNRYPDAKCKPCRNRHSYDNYRQYKDAEKLYGLSRERFEELYETFEVCCICERPPHSKRRRLSIDHDHESGAVRGLLCQHCNAALGMFQDSPVLLRKAAEYLQHPPF